MRTRIKAALAGNLKRGEGQKKFTEVVDAEFDRAGRSRLKPYQIATIYETNTATAFSAGQMATMLEVQEDFPFWQFSAVMDSRTSPEHAALHGKIFRNGDFTFFPPLRHRCRCTARLLTAQQAGREPRSAMPGADQRAELYAKAGNPEFAGHKQANYIAWLQEEYKNADPATRKLIDQATDQLKKELREQGKAMPKQSEIKTQQAAEPGVIPQQLAQGSDYLKGSAVRFDEKFFKLIDPKQPVKLVLSKSASNSSYQPGTKTVTIALNRVASDWQREKVIYHEFGHAIDWQRGMRNAGRATEMLKNWQKILGQKTAGKYGGMSRIAYLNNRLNEIYYRIKYMDDNILKRRGVTKMDALAQIGATMDTIMAINPQYGWGHRVSYFRNPGMREAEFIAHCFENRFSGNRIFEKYLPELYQATRDYIDALQ